jgi:hypothetical protein
MDGGNTLKVLTRPTRNLPHSATPDTCLLFLHNTPSSQTIILQPIVNIYNKYSGLIFALPVTAGAAALYRQMWGNISNFGA